MSPILAYTCIWVGILVLLTARTPMIWFRWPNERFIRLKVDILANIRHNNSFSPYENWILLILIWANKLLIPDDNFDFYGTLQIITRHLSPTVSKSFKWNTGVGSMIHLTHKIWDTFNEPIFRQLLNNEWYRKLIFRLQIRVPAVALSKFKVIFFITKPSFGWY